MIFSNRSFAKGTRVSISIEGRSILCEAFVDSGNLAKDPMGLRPILFIDRELAIKLLPRNVIELDDIDSLGDAYRKRIRLIPITRLGKTHVMTGVVPDRVEVMIDGEMVAVDMTIAIDKEGGGYGGFDALLPLAVIENAL